MSSNHTCGKSAEELDVEQEEVIEYAEALEDIIREAGHEPPERPDELKGVVSKKRAAQSSQSSE